MEGLTNTSKSYSSTIQSFEDLSILSIQEEEDDLSFPQTTCEESEYTTNRTDNSSRHQSKHI